MDYITRINLDLNELREKEKVKRKGSNNKEKRLGKNVEIYKGQLVLYIKKLDRANKPVYSLAVSLEDNFEEDKSLFICPIFKSCSLSEEMNNDKLVYLGMLPQIDDYEPYYAKLDSIKMIDKKLIFVKDKSKSLNNYGSIPPYIIDQLQVKYLILTGNKFNLMNETVKKVYFC